MINVGIVGCGRIIEDGHAPAFLELKDRFNVTALADPTPERRSVIGSMLNIPIDRQFADWNDLLKLDDIELVDMALPHFLHLESAVAAARSGKKILMEKPMATSMDEADQIMAAIRENNSIACIAHNYLFRHPTIKALELIKAGAIGEPFFYRQGAFMPRHYAGTSTYDSGWRSKSKMAGGGALIDNSYHHLYMAAALIGSPISSIFTNMGTFVHNIDVEDTVIMSLTHANGRMSAIETGWSTGAAHPVDELHGTEGSIVFNREPPYLQLHHNDTCIEIEITPGFTWGFKNLFEAYADTIEQELPPPVSFDDGYSNLKVVMSAYKSGHNSIAVNI
tara:strand:+ start:673 stop:1677 length:1005 start_codon:yes stop_codon:yes gene_type:complete